MLYTTTRPARDGSIEQREEQGMSISAGLIASAIALAVLTALYGGPKQLLKENRAQLARMERRR